MKNREPIYALKELLRIDNGEHAGRRGPVVHIEWVASQNYMYGISLVLSRAEWMTRKLKSRKALLADGTARLNDDGTVTLTYYILESSLTRVPL